MRKIILDFDGVLFDSAIEAYHVCELVAKSWEKLKLKSLTIEEFMRFRPKIKDSGDFLRYYADSEVQTDVLINEYKEKFYLARQELKHETDYSTKYFPIYEFTKNLIPLIMEHPDFFYILSTRDINSIQTVIQRYVPFKKENIFAQDKYKIFGSKLKILREMEIDPINCIFIDDLHEHLEEFQDSGAKILQANWGYGGTETSLSVSQDVAFSIISNEINGL